MQSVCNSTFLIQKTEAVGIYKQSWLGKNDTF